MLFGSPCGLYRRTATAGDRDKALEKFTLIITRLRQIVEEFCTTLDCVDVGFIPDDLLDALPAASQLGSTRVGGIDVNKPRSRAVLTAALALPSSPAAFTVADFAAKSAT